MTTECRTEQFEFEGLEERRVVACFGGGAITADAGALVLRHTDKAIVLTAPTVLRKAQNQSRKFRLVLIG